MQIFWQKFRRERLTWPGVSFLKAGSSHSCVTVLRHGVAPRTLSGVWPRSDVPVLTT